MTEFQQNLVRNFQLELLNEGAIEFLGATRQLHAIYENLPVDERSDDPGRDLARFLPQEDAERYLLLDHEGQPIGGQEISPPLQTLLEPGVLEAFWAEAADGGPNDFSADNFVSYVEGRAEAPAMLYLRAYPEQGILLGMGRLQEITDIRLESFGDFSAAAFERLLRKGAGVYAGLILVAIALTGLVFHYVLFSPMARFMTSMAGDASTPESGRLTWKRFREYATRLQRLDEQKLAMRSRLEREIDARYQAESERDFLRSNLQRALEEGRRELQGQAVQTLGDLQVALLRRESRVLSCQLLPGMETALRLLPEGPDTAPTRDAITRCLFSARALSDPGKGLAPLELRETALRPWIEAIAEDFTASRSIPVSSHTCGDLVARIEPDALRQAIECVMDNAAIASRNGAGIRLDSMRENEWVEIRVIDQGVGIPDEARPHIFLPFYTLSSEADGLGLALTRSVVESHGGVIDIHTEVDKGTAVIIRLPAS